MGEITQSWSDYYNTPEWAEKRTARLKLDGFKCAVCGFTRALEVHHINYERFRHEDVSRDLITLCKKCHKEIEAEKRKQDKRAKREPQLLSSGVYRFCVKNHAVSWRNTDWAPRGVTILDCTLEIPCKHNGIYETALIGDAFAVCKGHMTKIRKFTDCIGLTPTSGTVHVNLNNVDGMCGVCKIGVSDGADGDKTATVLEYYQPSSAMLTIANDLPWYEYLSRIADEIEASAEPFS